MSGAPTGDGVVPAAVIVLAKAPVPGHAKTRLSPPLSASAAASLAEAALRDTLECVAATPVARRVLALDGPVGDWLPGGFEAIEQRGEGLDERIAAAFADVGGPALLLGMDTPQLTAEALTRAVRLLLEGPDGAVLGTAADGGWWALGLRDARPEAVLGVPMGSGRTGSAQLARLRSLGLDPSPLGELRDVDTIADARLVAEAAPRTRFARCLAGLDGVAGPAGARPDRAEGAEGEAGARRPRGESA